MSRPTAKFFFLFGATLGVVLVGSGLVIWQRKHRKGIQNSSESAIGSSAQNKAPILRYEPQAIGAPVSEFGRPLVTHVMTADLDQDGLIDVVYCEAQKNSVRWIRQSPRGVFTEQILAEAIPAPAHVAVADVNGSGRLDVLVASMGQITPNNDLIGSVVVLENLDNRHFASHVILDHVARVSDVAAGKLLARADGKLDLVVGQFGYAQGETRWMENKGGWTFESHVVNRQSGCIHTPVTDFDGDGRVDFAALISQEWEEVHWFQNRGEGHFDDTLIWGSTNEDYGSSGLVVADVNRDGKPDLLYTNGDQFDYSVQGVRPWHGLQWLENRGGGAFTFHRVGDFPKAYGPCAADLNGDGYLDLVAVCGYSDSRDPKSASIMAWLNDGRENFAPIVIARTPVQLITAAVGDLDGNGVPVIVTGGFCSAPPFQDMSNVTLWRRVSEPSPAVARTDSAQENREITSNGAVAVEARIAAVRESLKKSGDSVEAMAELGRLHHENGYTKEAATIWEALARLEPGQARWKYFLADARLSLDDRDEAAQALRHTLENQPDYAPAWLRLADLEFKRGNFPAAADAYRQRLKLEPKDAYARLGLFRIAREQRSADRAAEKQLLEEIIRDTPEFPPAHNLYAEFLEEEGDHERALIERWIGRETGRFRDPDDPWLTALHDWCFDPHRLLLLGTIDFQTGKSAEALKFLQRAEELAGDDPLILETIGSLYSKLGDARRATATLERGIKIAENRKIFSAGLYVELSSAWRTLGKPTEALKSAERGVAQLGPMTELQNARGLALANLQRNAEAVDAYLLGLAKNPHDPETNANLAVTLETLGKFDEARAALDRALILRPTFTQALRTRVTLEMSEGNLTAAAKFLQPLYEANIGLPEVRQLSAHWHYLAAQEHESQNDAAKAEVEYRAGLKIDSMMPDLQGGLGVLLLVHGRYEEAVAPLEAFHRLQPENAQTALYLGQGYMKVGRAIDARRVLLEGIQVAERSGRSETAEHCREILRRLGPE